MNITRLPIAGAALVDTRRIEDHRGAFARLFCTDALAPLLGHRHIVQANHSRTREVGAVRGLHFQLAPHAEMKLVRCLTGRVWDVVVDLRASSPSFLQWHAEELSAKNARMMVIPEGCAHGFQVLEPDSELMYLHTAAYAPHAEGGVRHDDPLIAIRWPLPMTDLSARDASHPLLSAGFAGITP
jgi:dTDP-4-dehydrorhamnose 3,5-epimerase